MNNNIINHGETSDKDLINYAKNHNIKLNGVLPKSQLKNLDLKNGNYILNLSNYSHWVGMIIEKNKIYYFNAFGVVPPQEIEDKAKIYGFKEIIYNKDIDIQSIKSGYCGSFVMLWLDEMKKK